MAGEEDLVHAAAGRPDVLLVPGLGLNADAWAPTVRAMGRPANVVLLPGYGARSGPDDDLRPRALAERFIATAPWPEKGGVLFGHSASCQVAAQVAALAGRRISALVLIGPTTSPDSTTWPALAGRWLRTARHEDPRQVAGLARQYSRTGLVSMYRAMNAARFDRIEQTLQSATCATLVIRGVHDAICPAGWAATVASAVQCDRSSSVTLPQGGHMVPSTHGELVALTVARFLRVDR